MHELIEKLRKEWTSIVSAPMSFVTAVLILTGAGIGVVYWLLGTQLQNKTATIEAQDHLLAEYRQREQVRTANQLAIPGNTSGENAQTAYNECGWFSPNYPVKVLTPLSTKSNDELRVVAKNQSSHLVEIEHKNTAELQSIADDKSGADIASIQKKLDSARERQTKEFQDAELTNTRVLENELLTRLSLPHPVDDSAGLSSDGYCAIMTGIIRGDSALSSIGTYLVNMSRKLP